jgi:hypothetical protein
MRKGGRSLKAGLIIYNMRDVIRAYQSTSAGVIEPYDGYIARDS